MLKNENTPTIYHFILVFGSSTALSALAAKDEKKYKPKYEDKEIMFRLGILLFQQGQNAKGLQIYEELKNLQFSRADELIDFYDANIKREYHISDL